MFLALFFYFSKDVSYFSIVFTNNNEKELKEGKKVHIPTYKSLIRKK